MVKQADDDPRGGAAIARTDAPPEDAASTRYTPTPSRPDTDLRSTQRRKLTPAELQELFRAEGDAPDGRLTPVADPTLVRGALDGARASVPSRGPPSAWILTHPRTSRARTALAVAAGCTISGAALFAYLVTPANAVRPPPVAAAPLTPGERAHARAVPSLPSSISSVPVSAAALPQPALSAPAARSTPEPEAPSASSHTPAPSGNGASGKPPPPFDLTDKL